MVAWLWIGINSHKCNAIDEMKIYLLIFHHLIKKLPSNYSPCHCGVSIFWKGAYKTTWFSALQRNHFIFGTNAAHAGSDEFMSWYLISLYILKTMQPWYLYQALIRMKPTVTTLGSHMVFCVGNGPVEKQPIHAPERVDVTIRLKWHIHERVVWTESKACCLGVVPISCQNSVVFARSYLSRVCTSLCPAPPSLQKYRTPSPIIRPGKMIG